MAAAATSAAPAWRSPIALLTASPFLVLGLGGAIPRAGAVTPWLAAALIACALIAVYRRDWNRTRARRGEFFSDCLGLFESYRVVQLNLDYPVVQGRYRGLEVRLEPVVDHIAWRKLPSLWLKVTVLHPTPYQGVLDLMVRPQGIEFYSPSGELEHRLRLPPAWPGGAILCTDDPAAMPPLELIEPHLHLFDEPRMKELLITPHGVRLVRQVWQGERAEYLVLRQVRFAESRLQPALARQMLEAVLVVSASLWDALEPLAKAS